MDQAATSTTEQPDLAAAQLREPSFSWQRGAVSAVLILLVAVVAGRMFWWLSGLKKAPPREKASPPVLRVETFRVERSDLKRFVSAFGTARAMREVIVSAEVSGRVTEAERLKVGRLVRGADVHVNDAGKTERHTGDVLVQIDPQTYEERVQQVHALLAQDQTNLELLDQEHATNLELLAQQKRRLETVLKEFQRREQLLSQGAGNEVELERARLELEQYREAEIRLNKEVQLYPVRTQEIQTRIRSHRSELTLSELELEKAAVKAPFRGRISGVYVEEGQYVRPGERLIQLTDLDRIEIPVALPPAGAADVERLLAETRTVPAELARYEEDFVNPSAQIWHGQVTRIAPIADERTRTVTVFVEVDNEEQGEPLRPGSFVYARINAGWIPRAEGVLIPRDSIVDGDVYVAETREGSGKAAEADAEDALERRSPDSVARRKRVSVGQVYQTFALVTSGLEEGDRIVMTNLDIVREGVLLEVHDEHSLAEEFERLRVPYLERAQASALSRP